MKKVFLLMSLCIMIVLTSCANVSSQAVNSGSSGKKIESRNITGSTQPPAAPAQPTLNSAVTASVQDSSDSANISSEGMDIKKYKGHFYSGKAVVLTFHHISDKPFSGITIKPERFETDLKLLKDNGFNVISLSRMISCMQGTDTLPENAVVISFDDGIESFYKYAYPLLKKYNMPAVNFIITSRTEAYTPSVNDYNPLSPAEIKEMYDSGLVDIESHTHNSHDFVIINDKLQKSAKLAFRIYDPATKTYESEEHYQNRVLEDLKTSSDIIYKYTGHYPQMLCFPFGGYNKKVIELARQCGFEYFITTLYGNNKQNSHSNMIYRIRAGDAGLKPEKLIENIINCGNDIKPVNRSKTEDKSKNSTNQNNTGSLTNITAVPAKPADKNESTSKSN